MRTSNVTYLIKKGVSSVWKNRVMSFASFGILLVSLLLVSCTVLMMINVSIVMGNIENTTEIAVYIEEGATPAQLSDIQAALESNSDLAEVRFITKEEALTSFREDMAEYAELLDNLEENPMPETFMASVTDPTKIRHIVNVISEMAGVEKVKAPYDFAGILVNVRNTFSFIAGGVLLALIILSVFIVSNTIRTSVYSRRTELNIMKYVGATDGFIKAPFFVEGMFIGAIAGVGAWALTWVVYNTVFSLFSGGDITLWRMFGFFDLLPFDDIKWLVLLINCVAGALLGAVGTVISTGKHLKV